MLLLLLLLLDIASCVFGAALLSMPYFSSIFKRQRKNKNEYKYIRKTRTKKEYNENERKSLQKDTYIHIYTTYNNKRGYNSSRIQFANKVLLSHSCSLTNTHTHTHIHIMQWHIWRKHCEHTHTSCQSLGVSECEGEKASEAVCIFIFNLCRHLFR